MPEAKKPVMLEDVLSKLNLKMEDLNSAERQTAIEWLGVLSGKKMDFEKLVAFIKTRKDQVNVEISEWSNPPAKDLFLKVEARMLTMFENFVMAPTRSKEWLSEYLKSTHKI